MSDALAAPVLVPLLTAIALAPWAGRPRLQRRIAAVSGAALLAITAWIAWRTAGGRILVLRVGGWSPHVGVVWVADALAAAVLVAASVVSLAATLYAPGALRGALERRYFYPLHQLMMVGVLGAFLTGDFFNLFVFYEIMLLASFGLVLLGARPAQLRAGFPYVVVNLVASALFLGAAGVLYGTAGTVNMAEVAARVQAGGLPPAYPAAAALLVVVFAIKAALAPLFFWLPDAYPEAPIVVTALAAGLLTKVGVYTLFRAVPILAGPERGPVHAALLALAAVTMVVGVVGALGRGTIRGVLSFHIVSQVGYMIFGLAIFTPVAVAAGIFHLLHNMITKTALVFAGGIVERVGRSGSLAGPRGLASTHPWVAAAFFVPALSLVGIPPLSGFWGKLFLVVGGLRAGAPLVVAISLFVGLLTLASMLKIWTTVFWGDPAGQRAPSSGRHRGMLAGSLLLAALTVVAGLFGAPLFGHLERAAEGLVRVEPYVSAVLGAPREEGGR